MPIIRPKLVFLAVQEGLLSTVATSSILSAMSSHEPVLIPVFRPSSLKIAADFVFSPVLNSSMLKHGRVVVCPIAMDNADSMLTTRPIGVCQSVPPCLTFSLITPHTPVSHLVLSLPHWATIAPMPVPSALGHAT